MDLFQMVLKIISILVALFSLSIHDLYTLSSLMNIKLSFSSDLTLYLCFLFNNNIFLRFY